MSKMFNGQYLKKCREKAGFTQLELADRVNSEYQEHIVDVTTIARWEHNPSAVPRNNKIVKVAKTLGVPVESLYDIDFDVNVKEDSGEEVKEEIMAREEVIDQVTITFTGWNLHAMGGNEYIIPKFVPDVILQENSDAVVLTEFSIAASNFECFKENIEKKYDLFISPYAANGRNQIAILIKKGALNINDMITVNPFDNGKPEILQINLIYKDMPLSIIAVRIKTQAKKIEEQFRFLTTYLQSIKTDFICVGDFNATEKHLDLQFNGFKIGTPLHDKKKYYTDNWYDNYSYLFVKENVISGAAALDHVIVNNGIVKEIKYNWEFIKRSNIYPKANRIIKGNMWNVPKGYPDHAVLTFKYSKM